MNEQVKEIWIDLHQELKNFIYRKTKNKEVSEDILQDVFVKIFLNIHTLNEAAKLTAWVYQITRNVLIDYYRKTKPILELKNFDLAEQAQDEPLYLSLSNCINQKINQLSEKYQQAILLTYFDNHSQIASAEELNISYSGLKTRVQRAREQLKELVLTCKNVELDQQGNLIDYQNIDK